MNYKLKLYVELIDNANQNLNKMLSNYKRIKNSISGNINYNLLDKRQKNNSQSFISIIKDVNIKENDKNKNIIQEKNKLNEMTIKYKINNYLNIIRIIDDKFVKNNKNKCKIIEGKENELIEYIDIDVIKIKDILEIKLQEIILITDMSYMFYNCEGLSSLSDISKWDTKNITNMNKIFYNCNKLSLLTDISK